MLSGAELELDSSSDFSPRSKTRARVANQGHPNYPRAPPKYSYREGTTSSRAKAVSAHNDYAGGTQSQLRSQSSRNPGKILVLHSETFAGRFDDREQFRAFTFVNWVFACVNYWVICNCNACRFKIT